MISFISIFVITYIWHALGITIGYHRLLSHRSFSAAKLAEYFWVVAGYLAFEGSPIWWATIHRAHHRYVDTPLDPHSPKYGLKNAHTGWLTRGYQEHTNPQSLCKDLIKDPLYRFLEQGGDWSRAHFLSFFIGFSFRAVILVCFGWQAALASLLAGLAVLQIPLMLNVVCHIPQMGYRNYAVKDESVNVWWVGLLAMGEGWHNNHHAAPSSAKTGVRAWEFDASWLVILLMKKLGLVSRVRIYEGISSRSNVRHADFPRKGSTRTAPATELCTAATRRASRKIPRTLAANK
jgi:stearoyl-CoA desaturase (delta-9 desaturase)